MEKTTRLADLKLVNKYYPSVSNYSYPRYDAITTGHRCEQPVTGRSSVGSECSVPEMVDDQESDVSAEDTNQSHIVCDETFDSFWEDSEAFWGIEAGEKSNTVFIGPITHSTALRQDGSRTLPPATRQHAPHRSVEDVENNAKPCWPLVAAEPCIAATSKPSKPSYSLFPPPTATPQQSLLLRRPPGGQTRSEIPWDTQKQIIPTVSLPLPNRRKKPRKLHLPASDGAIRYDSSSLTQSAPGTPTFLMASPTAVAFSRRSQQTLPSQRNFSLSRAHSDIKIVHCPPPDISPQKQTTQLAVPAQSQDVPRGRKTHQRTQSQLRQSISATEVPSSARTIPSPVESIAHPPRTPSCTSRPTTPQTQQTAMPVSVFEFDSDSDEDADSAANFARRIVKNLTPHKRSRSASAAPRSRKGSDIAEKQLRRVRADTVTSPVDGQPPPVSEGLGVEDKDDEGPYAVPALRRQKSEVFGTIFGRKR